MGSTYRLEGVSQLSSGSAFGCSHLIPFPSDSPFLFFFLGTTGREKRQHSVTVSAISFIHPTLGNQLLQLPSSWHLFCEAISNLQLQTGCDLHLK